MTGPTVSAAQTWCIVVASIAFTVGCVIWARFIYAPPEATQILPGPAAHDAAVRTSDGAGESPFLAAPVADDTVLDGTVIMPRQWFAAWAHRDPVQAYAWRARENQREWLTVARAGTVRESARRIGEAIRSRRVVAAQADLIAAIRASYAELTLEGTWDDLVAAISAVIGSAA